MVAICIACGVLAAYGQANAVEFTGGVWIGDVNGPRPPGGQGSWVMLDENYARMLAEPDLEYMHCQFTVVDVINPSPHTIAAKQMIAEMKAAGKKVVLQLWSNMDVPETNWSYYSIAHTSLDPFVRMRWHATLGEAIRYFGGAETLYAVLLWEEIAGVNVGWDIPVSAEDKWRANKNSVVEGSTAGSSAYSASGWPIGRSKEARDGPYMPQMIAHRDEILALGGIDVLKADDWTEEDYRQFRFVVSRYMTAAMNVQFAEFVHTQFPGLKVFSWCYPAMAGDKWTDIGWEAQHGVDGWVGDPYGGHAYNYTWVRTARALFGPEKEVHAIFHQDRPQDVLERGVEVAYAGGANSISFFTGDNNRRGAGGLDDSLAAMKKFLDRPIARPVLAEPYDTLVVSDDYYNSAQALFPKLGGRFDVVSSIDRYALWQDESKYRRVLDTTAGKQALWMKAE